MMLELFQNASDDAVALMFCGGALLVSGSIMFFSKFMNPAAQQAELSDRPQLRLARPELAEEPIQAQEKAA